MQTYEVEVKALLGEAERAEEIRRAMKKADPSCTMRSRNKQLNHYFEDGSLVKLSEAIAPHLGEGAKKKFSDIAERGRNFSVRTRLTASNAQAGDKDGKVFLVVKASVDDTTSENGIARMEFEEPVCVRDLRTGRKVPMTLQRLDELVLKSKFKYQAKWSREREEYVCLGTNVTLDKNAGYGWLAEFERIVDDQGKLDGARREIHALMEKLAVPELPQSRLERMFAYYNEHWKEYYGTEKTFIVE